MAAINHFEVLGFPPSGYHTKGTKITQEEIKKAYRSKALELHPDKRHNDPNANSDFQRLQSSYDFLTNQPSGETTNDSHFRATTPQPRTRSRRPQQHQQRPNRRPRHEEDATSPYYKKVDVDMDMMNSADHIRFNKKFYENMVDREERKRDFERRQAKDRARDFANKEDVEVKDKKAKKSTEEILWASVTKFRYCREAMLKRQKHYDFEARYGKWHVCV